MRHEMFPPAWAPRHLDTPYERIVFYEPSAGTYRFLIIKLSFYHVPPLCESFSNFFTSNVVFMCVLGTSRSKCKSTQGSSNRVDNNEWLKSHCAPLITPRRRFRGMAGNKSRSNCHGEPKVSGKELFVICFNSFSINRSKTTTTEEEMRKELRHVTDLCTSGARRGKHKKKK